MTNPTRNLTPDEIAKIDPTAPRAWVVIYMTGGTLNAEWHKTREYATYSEAEAVCEEIRRGGRRALVHDARLLDRIGMPEGATA